MSITGCTINQTRVFPEVQRLERCWLGLCLSVLFCLFVFCWLLLFFFFVQCFMNMCVGVNVCLGEAPNTYQGTSICFLAALLVLPETSVCWEGEYNSVLSW